jgi:multicomponent Na+:H+ antiporter subunit D
LLAAHFPVLLVVTPLVAAPLIVVVRSARAGWAMALATCLAAVLMAAELLARVATSGPVSYAIGSWPPPWGIEYRVDAASALVALLVAAIGTASVVYARRSAAAEIGGERQYLFYALMMLCLAGLLGMVVTGDAFNLFVFLEISSLSTYVLVAMGRDRRALTASFQYLILGTVGATFYVMGIGILYLATGTLNLADLAARLPQVADPRAATVAIAFITTGLGLKLAMFPLHAWLPNAYAHAPSAVSAFLAGTATKVSIYALARIWFSVYGADGMLREIPVAPILAALSVAAAFIASGAAIVQDDLKRMLAYSSVGQIGYITLGLSLATEPGVAAAVAHVVNHGVTKSALFLLAGGMALRLGGTRFSDLAGVGRTMPVTTFAFVIGGLSLIGVPGTAGFVTKWALAGAAIRAGQPVFAAVVLLSSLLALAYVWRFVECAYFREPPAGSPAPGEAPASMTGTALVLTAAVVAMGLHGAPVLHAAERAAAALMGGAR